MSLGSLGMSMSGSEVTRTRTSGQTLRRLEALGEQRRREEHFFLKRLAFDPDPVEVFLRDLVLVHGGRDGLVLGAERICVFYRTRLNRKRLALRLELAKTREHVEARAPRDLAEDVVCQKPHLAERFEGAKECAHRGADI